MSDDTLEKTIPADVESSFSQVVFVNIPHSYQINASVKCCYILTEGLIPNTRDWIGIFKVGWHSTQNYYSYVWVQPSLKHDRPEALQQEVVFGESYLPKDDAEFYQFCYVDSGGVVRGASTPFFFKNPTESSLDCSLENDLLVITTQEQAEQMEKEKESLLSEMEHLKEENKILKNELDERLHEIRRLRVHIDQLKCSSMTETLPSNEQKPQVDEQITQEQQLIFHTVTENEAKQEQESLTHICEKYKKASQKIIMLKEEKAQLMQKNEVQQAEISELSPKIKEALHGYNTLQDHVQLLQVDYQSKQKENERLQADKQAMMGEMAELRQEIKDLRASLQQQEPSEGDQGSRKIQTQTLLTQLTETRRTLRKEIQNSNEANKRAERAEREMAELKKQLEQMAITVLTKEQNHPTEFEDALKRIDEQTNVAEVVQAENQKLKDDIEKLQKALYELQVASVAAASQHQHSTLSSSSTAPINPTTSHYYESINNLSGTSTGTENKLRVCQHCHESFPDISEDELEMHEQCHKVCPFCTLICDDMKQQEFEDHVYSHEE